MSYLKRKVGHASPSLIYRYLYFGLGGDGNRALAWDTNLSAQELDEVGGEWWRIMERTAHEHGHDRPPSNGGRCRTYYHYILAPDPRDFEGLSHEEGLRRVRRMACDWADAFLPNHQYAIVYHDDSAAGNIHAHVVCGVTDMVTGRKRQESDREWERGKRLANETSELHGLSAFRDEGEIEEDVELLFAMANRGREERGEDPILAGEADRTAAEGLARAGRRDRSPGRTSTTLSERPTRAPRSSTEPASGRRRTTQRRSSTQAERAMRSRGRASWKDEIRFAADRAANAASSFEEYRRLLQAEGFDVYRNRRGNLVYMHSDGKMRCGDDKLGVGYSTDLLATRFMDLRMTKEAWRRNAASWRVDKTTGERRTTLRTSDLRPAYAALASLGLHDAAEAREALAGERETYRRRLDAVESLDARIRRLDALREDAGMVDVLADEIEPTRQRGRVTTVDLPAEQVSEYEVARKRLMRAGYRVTAGGGVLSEVARDIATLERDAQDARRRLGASEERLRDLSEALPLVEEMDRRREAEDARMASSYRQRVTVWMTVGMRTSPSPSSTAPRGVPGRLPVPTGRVGEPVGQDALWAAVAFQVTRPARSVASRDDEGETLAPLPERQPVIDDVGEVVGTDSVAALSAAQRRLEEQIVATAIARLEADVPSHAPNSRDGAVGVRRDIETREVAVVTDETHEVGQGHGDLGQDVPQQAVGDDLPEVAVQPEEPEAPGQGGAAVAPADAGVAGPSAPEAQEAPSGLEVPQAEPDAAQDDEHREDDAR